MSQYTPSVEIATTISTRLLSDANDGSAFIIATSNWGPEHEFLEYEGSSEISSAFKSGALPTAANMFVLGGGRDVSVYRFVPSDADKSEVTLAAGAVDSITLTAKYNGSYGNNLTVQVQVNSTTKRNIIISDGVSREVYDNEGDGYATNEEIVTALAVSNFVTATLIDNNTIVDELTATQFSGGSSGSAITISDILTIIDTYMDREYSYLLVPEITTDASQALLADKMETRAEQQKIFSIVCVGVVENESYATTVARTATSTNGRIIKMAPGTFRLADVNYNGGYGACYYAGLLAKQQLGVSLTHKSFGLDKYVNYSTDVVNYTPAQVDRLIGAGFTVVNKIGNYNGIVRAVTAITDKTNPFFEQVILKEIDYIKTNLYNILNPFIGEPNTSQKREEIKGVIQTFMDRAVTNKVINGYETEVILEGVDSVRVNLLVEPTYPINKIYVNLTI